MQDSVIDPAQLNTLMASRRAVFTTQFVAGKTIPDEIVWQLLENANWAPTHKRTEPWRFVVFTGQGLQKLAEFQASRYRQTAGAAFKPEKAEKLLRTPGECSHVIALGMKRSLQTAIPEIEEIAAVACAVQNIWLSAGAYGLGGYWSTGGVNYDEAAKGFFQLGPQDRLMGFFYLGYVRVASAAGSRNPVTDKTIWVRE